MNGVEISTSPATIGWVRKILRETLQENGITISGYLLLDGI